MLWDNLWFNVTMNVCCALVGGCLCLVKGRDRYFGIFLLATGVVCLLHSLKLLRF
jgi:hypothetical protein